MKSPEEIRAEVNQEMRQRLKADGASPGSDEYFEHVAIAALIDIAASLRYFVGLTEEAEDRDATGRLKL